MDFNVCETRKIKINLYRKTNVQKLDKEKRQLMLNIENIFSILIRINELKKVKDKM